ncbi:hypothetical protein KP509_1Z268500 [Ceratopteris richardii]|nr:hypothetical protein KP509_1Z268500 [Ceratopteris richardii]
MASNDASSAKRQKPMEPPKECEAFSGLETLAYLATVEGDMSAAPTSPATITGKTSPVISCVPSTTEAVAASSRMVSVASSSSSPATTTKHPRHRPGCTCIVCIQPPSGKGPKHKPNCDCNVCVTVKRRFHTLMLRRKKLQSEKEAESSSQKNQPMLKESMEGIRAKRPNDLSSSAHKNGSWQGGVVPSFMKSMPQITDAILSKNGEALKLASTSPYVPVVVKMESNLQIGSKGPQIDLNSQPEEDSKSTPGLSMKSLLQNASYPLDIYLKQHGLTSLVCNDKLQGALECGSGFPCVKKDSTPEERDSVVAVYSCEQHGHSEPLPESHVKL